MLWTLSACLHTPAPPTPAGDDPAATGPGTPSPVLPTLDEPALAALLANAGEERLVVNFWATWCGPCIDEMGLLAAAAGEHPDADFALVSVDERGQADRVAAFLTSRDIHLPVWHLDVPDASATLGRTVPAWPDLIPVTLVIEPGGEVRARFDGVLDEAALREALR